MCLQRLEDLVEPGVRMIDVGTGSGILSIAAIKLGAGRVLALDTDYLAVLAAGENAVRNGVGEQIQLFQGQLNAVQAVPAELVMVNILAPVIIHLLAKVRLADYLGPQGRLILSGIIDEQESDVLVALEAAGLVAKDRRNVRDWICLTAVNA